MSEEGIAEPTGAEAQGSAVATSAPQVEPSTVAPPSPKETGRLKALDVARGIALLGIVLVNVDLFAVPLGLLEYPGPWESGTLPLAASVFVAIFCAGKFYPLFSLLFGIGVSLQRSNVESRGGRYIPLGLRRMAILSLFGIAHVILLWYGDILFFYATAGMGAVLLSGTKAATKIRLGVALVLFATLVMAAITWFVPAGDASALDLKEQAALVEVGDAPFTEVISKIDQLERNLADPLWIAAETKGYKEGGFIQALGFRLLSYATMLAIGAVGLWWIVLGLFLIGGGLYEWGLFEAEKERALLGFVVLMMMVGLPLSAGAVLLARSSELGPLAGTLAIVSPLIVGPIVALGYLSAVTLMVRHHFLEGLTTAVSAAGRMALTNYLLQSTILAFVFYHWGLGKYGEIPGHQRVLLVLGMFVVQVMVSQWWLQRFRFGPLEWLWRSATYLRLQPFKR